MATDLVRMTSSLTARRSASHLQAVPAFEVVEWSNHWRKVGQRWYRDAVARNGAGELRLVSFPDGIAA
jgi:hypothetical protein